MTAAPPPGGDPYGPPPRGPYASAPPAQPHGAPPPHVGAPYGAAPPGWPGPAPRRRSPLSVAIAVFGVLGAVVLAVGLTLLAGGRLIAAVGAGSSSSAAAPSGPQVTTRSLDALAASLDHAHAGIAVPAADAPPADGSLDPGERVRRAPGVLLVETRLEAMQGTGTGMVLTSDGLALTNYHVVEDSTAVSVVVADTGARHAATVLGRDAKNDVAVLQIDGVSGLTTTSVSRDPVRPGEAVAAVGNGGGQGYLTSVGGEVLRVDQSILAATEGTDDFERLTGLIQTDADVVPGYSGGPLVDGEGQVVGVTVAASEGRTAAQVDGYAIPLSTAFDVVAQVLSGEETDSVSIGADGSLGISVAGSRDGVEVLSVDRGSAGEELGLRPGDVITAIDGRTLDGNATAMSRLVNDHEVGDRLSVQWRTADGEARQGEAVLQKARHN